MRNQFTLVTFAGMSAAGLLSVLITFAHAQEQAPHDDKALPRLPGMQATGHVLLPTQWSLKPEGKQLPVGDFPVTIAMHPKLPFAAVLHAGYGEHEVVIVDLEKFRVVSRASVPE